MRETPSIALEVKNISKKYFIAKSGHSEVNDDKHFWALNDVSFTLYHGDVLGIIGNNGSGKSTLLKILSHITKPSSGEARFYGSATSILDIGNNFHPDLTGRENVKIQLRLADIKPKEFDFYYNNVKQFSEIGEFFDQPVKFYSSGMFLRLAFSLAFHISSEILVLDEVLSVGDEGFRLKCQELLKAFAQMGKTILFVSHNRLEILELSNKCIWLDKGRIRKSGLPSEILGEYFAEHREKFDTQRNILDFNVSQIGDNGTIHLFWDENNSPGNDVLSMRQLSVGPPNKKLTQSDPIEIEFLINKKKRGIQVGAFFFIQDIFYQPVLVGHFLNNTEQKKFGSDMKDQIGLIKISCTIPANFLIPGKYYFLVRFGMEENEWHSTSTEAFRFSEKLSFTIHASSEYIDYVGDVSKGSVRPKLQWSVEKKING